MEEQANPLQIGWIDFSNQEKEHILDILKSLKEDGAVDELGIGVIRDCFSDKLFPGFSTLYTRAKYLVLIPYIFEVVKNATFESERDVIKSIRELEFEMVEPLYKSITKKDIKYYGSYGGVMGAMKWKGRHEALVRMPSAIYWNGLHKYGILTKDITFVQACNLIFNNRDEILSNDKRKKNDQELNDDNPPVQQLFHMPPNSNGMTKSKLKDMKIELTTNEQEFLKKQIKNSSRMQNSLTLWLLNHKASIADTMSQFGDKKVYDFNSLDYKKINNNDLAKDVNLAQQFSRFIYGPEVLYNILLYEDAKKDTYKDIRSKLEQEYKDWTHEVQSGEFNKFNNVLKNDIPKICENHRVGKTLKFLTAIYEVLVVNKNRNAAEELIRKREVDIKKGRAKIGNPDKYPPNNNFLGTYQLSYRYNETVNIIHEILGENE
jgi:hypothetical protein